MQWNGGEYFECTYTHKHAFYHSLTPLATKWGCKPVVCLCVCTYDFQSLFYAFKACVNYVHTSFWSVLFPLNARVAAVCVCLCVFSYLVAFSSMGL